MASQALLSLSCVTNKIINKKLGQQAKRFGTLGPVREMTNQHVSKIQRHIFLMLKINPVVVHIYAAHDLGPKGHFQAPGDIKGMIKPVHIWGPRAFIWLLLF